MRVALAISKVMPEVDVDLDAAVGACRARGLDASVEAWDDPSVEWASFSVVVVKSTWGYAPQVDAFRAWLERVDGATHLLNPAAICIPNTDKRYLNDLRARGVPIVPTLFVPRTSTPPSLVELVQGRDMDDLVVKPVVSAGSFATARFHTAAEGEPFFKESVSLRDTMVQPYIPEVEARGERSLVFIDGVFTHAIRKGRRLAGDEENVTGPFAIEADEQRVAEAAIAPFRRRLLYGRVDVVRMSDGVVRVMELELTEPSLFFSFSEGALARYADAIARSARTPQST